MTHDLPIIREARQCTVCADTLPLGARPLLAGCATSRILIIGQAPGAAAHETNVPWNDRSGVRLRTWLGVSDTEFYDASLIALVPMGFCYPGKRAGGDAQPRPECAPLWHARIFDVLAAIKLTIYVGRFACERYLPRYAGLTDAVRAYERLLPRRIALPHPSPRNNIWLKQSPWFENDALPKLRRRVRAIIDRTVKK